MNDITHPQLIVSESSSHRIGTKFSQTAICLLLLLSICLGVFQSAIAIPLCAAAITAAVFILYRLRILNTPAFRFATTLITCALLIQLYHQSQGQEFFFLLFFLIAGLLILYEDKLLIWLPLSVFILHTLILLVLPGTTPFAWGGEKSWAYAGSLLLFTLLAAYLTGLLKRASQLASTLNKTLDELRLNSKSNTQYAELIASGNLDATYTPADGDVLGHSLRKMSQGLQKAAEDNRIRNWQIEGIAKISEIVRIHTNNLEELTSQTLSYLIKYLRANQGMAFVLNDENPDHLFLELTACYAFNRKKYLKKQIELGTGLVGQAFLEKETVYQTEIPENYFQITSGLGDAKPKSILIVPLKVEDTVVGVLEIASFQKLKEYEREFLEKISESIASSIVSSKRNSHTTRLLEDSQQMGEQMRAQEEEMRQNLEELSATQEDLQRKNIEREKAQLALRDSQRFIEGVLDSIPSPIFVKNRSHQFVMANQAYCKHMGFSKQQLLDSSPKEIFGESADLVWSKDEEVFLSQQSTSRESSMKNKEGLTICYIVTKSIYIHDDGAHFMIGIMSDISERKKDEDALHLDKLLFQMLMNNFPERINFKDHQGKFLKVNKAKALRHGLDDPSLIIGKSDFDYFQADHAQKAYEEEQAIMRSGKPIIDLEERLVYTDGTIAWGLTSKLPLFDQQGVTIGTFGITRDITDKKRAELNLTALQKMLKKIKQSLPIVLYKINKDHVLTEFSGAGERVFGVAEQEAVGKPALDLIPPLAQFLSKPLNDCIDFQQSITHNNESCTLSHTLFEDPTTAGGLIGFALKHTHSQLISK